MRDNDGGGNGGSNAGRGRDGSDGAEAVPGSEVAEGGGGDGDRGSSDSTVALPATSIQVNRLPLALRAYNPAVVAFPAAPTAEVASAPFESVHSFFASWIGGGQGDAGEDGDLQSVDELAPGVALVANEAADEVIAGSSATIREEEEGGTRLGGTMTDASSSGGGVISGMDCIVESFSGVGKSFCEMHSGENATEHWPPEPEKKKKKQRINRKKKNQRKNQLQTITLPDESGEGAEEAAEV